MRLHRLEIEGFGPFRHPQVIDFDQLAETGLFLIAGRTGAGKSSILDAVSFALYGAVPRYSSGEKRLRSDHSEPDEASKVSLEFSVNDVRYRIERSPEYQRPSRRGADKLTKQAAEVSLHRWEADTWSGLGARAKDVDGEYLPEILQLNREQFQQVILLAQNRFAGFLLAKSNERQEVLRTLFGTRRFEDYAEQLNERRRASSAQLASDNAVLMERLGTAEELIAAQSLTGTAHEQPDAEDDGEQTPQSDAPADRLQRVAGAVPRARYRVESARETATVAEQDHMRAADALMTERTRLAHQQERATARQALAALDAQLPALETVRAELASADAAEPLRATLELVTTSTDRHQHAQSTATEAIAAWQLVTTTHDTVVSALGLPVLQEPDDSLVHAAAFATAASQLTVLTGELAAAARTESELAQLREHHDAAVEAVRIAEQLVRELEQRAEELPAQQAHLEQKLAELATPAATHDAHQQQVASSAASLEAATNAEALNAQLRAAEAKLSDALLADSEAGTDLALRIRQRLDGHAAELALGLRAGEPCAVCGSTTHPKPTTFEGDIVTDADLTEAEQAKQTTLQQVTVATGAATELRERVAELNAAAGGRTRDQCEQLHAEALSALRESERAVQAQQQLMQERTVLASTQARMATEHADAATALTQARTAAATASERLENAERVQADARAHWDTVTERVSAVTTVRDAAHDVATALEEVTRRAQSMQGAHETLAELLTTSGFANETAAREALRTPEVRAAAREQVLTYDAERAREKETLLRLELEMLPDEPIDLTAPTLAAEAAREAWTAAQAAFTSAELVHEQLVHLVSNAEDAHRQIGDAAQQHAELARLADTVSGKEPNTKRMALETFVLAAELEEIVIAANARLDAMSSGRYRLVHSDERAARGAASGLGIDVFDSHTGRPRPATSLSGGETFLASLALALGLAEVVTARAGGVRLDTLFIDEGFGSLDGETLETAMHTLEELHAGGRTVGVISHVEAMHERIGHQLRVAIADDGSSIITQSADSLD